MEILLTGKKRWGLKYRTANRKQETVRRGDYLAYSLAEARAWRDDCKALVKRGLLPMALKRGDPIPAEATPAAREMAEAFVSKWCLKAKEAAKAKEDAAREADTVKVFAWRWYEEIARPANGNPRNIERILNLAGGSEWVFPSRGELHRPIAKSTLNVAVRALEIDVRDFVLHDFRHTASTHLHEQGFNSDWIEKALAYEQGAGRLQPRRIPCPTSPDAAMVGGLRRRPDQGRRWPRHHRAIREGVPVGGLNVCLGH